MKTKLAITNANLCRELANHPSFVATKLFTAKANKHKFKPGEIHILTGLEDFPEYNGRSVKITAIREDGPFGKAYYIKSKEIKEINWVYEYRLI